MSAAANQRNAAMRGEAVTPEFMRKLAEVVQWSENLTREEAVLGALWLNAMASECEREKNEDRS